MNKPIIKTWVILTISLILIGITAAPAAAETAWADNVVSYDPCWSSPDNILDVDDDVYAVGIDDGCAIVVDMGKVFSNGTVSVNRHYADVQPEYLVGIKIYVSSDTSSWTEIGYEIYIEDDPLPISDSNFTITFSQYMRYVKITRICEQDPACEMEIYLDSVRINGTAPLSKPDLIVEDIRLFNGFGNQITIPEEGKPYMVKVVIKNQGEEDADFEAIFDEALTLHINGIRFTGLPYQYLEDIPSGQSQTYTFNDTWIPDTAGLNTLRVVVDTGSMIEEMNETNNELTETVVVSSSAPGAIPDILVGYDTTVELLVDDTAGEFSSIGEVANVSNDIRGLAGGDFDGDGNTDFLVSESYSIQLFLGDGSGSFISNGVAASLDHDPRGITADDFDGDGDIDFLAAAYNVELYLNNGTGSFTYGGRVVTTDCAVGITSADFDGDGDVDLILSSMHGTKLYKNDGAGSFTLGGTVSGSSQVWGLTSGDFDGDGDADLLISNSYYINDGTGSFTFSATVSDDTLWSLTSNDFDGDGDIDFAAGNYSSNGVDLYENNGTGGFIRLGMILKVDSYLFIASGSYAPITEPIHPDLTPVNISSSTFFVNITNTVYAVIANNGNKGAGGFGVSFCVDGNVVDTATVSSLDIGNSTTISFEWLPDTISDYNVSIEVDTDNVVWELNETDNELIEIIPVVQGYADLVPVEIIVQDEIFVNLPVVVSAVIENNNTATAHTGSFNVSLLADGTPMDVITITQLSIGNNTTVEFDWMPEHTGNCTLTVVADRDDFINETNETNNELPAIVAVVQGYADLIPVEIITPDIIFANGSNTISTVIENSGTATAHTGSFNVSLLADGVVVDVAAVASLLIGEDTTVEFCWIAGHAGNYTLTVVADCDDDIVELNETNNNISEIVQVSPISGFIDLTVVKVDAYSTEPFPPYYNIPNTVNVIITNLGLETGPFNVTLYSNGEFVSKKTLTNAGQCSNVTVSFFHSWTPVCIMNIPGKHNCSFDCPSFNLSATVDADNDIDEENETNNNATTIPGVTYHQYASTGPLAQISHDKLHGGVLYTLGDSWYTAAGSMGHVTWHYDIALPESATPILARLCIPVWNDFCSEEINFSITVTHPNGTSYSVPDNFSRYCDWENTVWDLTEFISQSGVYTIDINNHGDGRCAAGAGLLVVYEDESKPLIEYWVTEGADVMCVGGSCNWYGITSDQSIGTALFPGQTNGTVVRALLGTANAWGNTYSTGTELYFNDISLGTGHYCAGSGHGSCTKSMGVVHMDSSDNAQHAISLTDVTDYFTDSDNHCAVQSRGDASQLLVNVFFVVEYGNDTIPPNVTEHSPEGDNVWVGSPITVTFSEAMNKTSTEDAFSIVPGIAGTFEWIGKVMTFTPTENLACNTTYNVTIGEAAKDRAENNIEAPYCWEFTTQAVEDTTPPNATTPSPAGVNVSIYTDVSVNFSEVMNQSSVENAFSIVPDIAGTFRWNDNTMTFSHDLLDYNITYNITITASATDLSGNSLDGNDNGISEGSPADDYTWQFTTEKQEFKSWDFDGFPLTTKSNGTVNGGVFISYGDNDQMENAKVKPYITNFSVPNGTPVWAKLYMHLWGGNPNNGGTVNVSFNSHDFETVVIEGKQTRDSHILGSGCGTWWLFFNVSELITPGDINRAQVSVTSESLDGRIARIVLVEAYEGGDDPQNVMYWVNDGHMNLHYNSSEYPWCLDSTKAWFNGTVPSGITQANLTGIWLTGSYGEPDYFYFNPPDAPDAPNGSNINWDIGNYSDYQFGAYDPWTGNMSYHDVAMGGGYSTNYFDIHSNTTTNTSTITNLLKNDNNYAIFWRGHDDNDDGWIYGAFGGDPTTYEGEGYVHPVLAALVLNFEGEDITPPYTDGHDPAPGDINVPVDTNITVHVKDSGAGVNVSSIEMKVNNVSVIPDISGTSADYELIYDPPVDFNLSETVNVNLYTCDLDDNCMQYVWEFTIESEQVVECGDVDGENGVTIGDGIQVAMYTIYGSEQYPLIYPWAADVDCENGITIGDGIQIAMSTIYGTEQYPLECC